MSQSANLKILDMQERGWLFEILKCVNLVPTQEFTIDDIYRFEKILSLRHPNNHNVKPKIRQLLQYLRDKGFIEFTQKGKYKKLL